MPLINHLNGKKMILLPKTLFCMIKHISCGFPTCMIQLYGWRSTGVHVKCFNSTQSNVMQIDLMLILACPLVKNN